MKMADIKNIVSKEGAHLELKEIGAKYSIKTISESPCRVACPAGVNVKAYIGLIAAGKFEQALEVEKRANPLPGICGRVCTYPCESECHRGEIDEPVAIRALKRFIADYELRYGKKEVHPIKRTKKEKVAIIGSGPAGLTAANDLIRSGYGVTIFEALPVAGGMLSVGIPAYRLPREIIKAEIDAIANLGVEIKTNTRVEDVDGLLTDGYNAVFIAIGAHKGLKLNIPGEDDFEGLIDCITFLKQVNLGNRSKPGKKVVVIGGGNSAIDSARTALRLGADAVYIVYRRSRKEMPADELEIKEAELEGVKIHYLAAPIRILGKNKKVVGMECTKMRLGEPDASGRRRPIPIEGSEFVIDADVIIPAISQKPDLSFLPEKHGLKISKWGSLEVDPNTLATNKLGIFAGGDAVTGPRTVIEAIAAGHKAAKSIDRYLSGKGLKESVAERKVSELELDLSIDDVVVERKERIEVPKLALNRRRGSFEEVELSLSEEQAIQEAKRCLRCGPCMECVECIKDCQKKLIAVSVPETISEEVLVRTWWVPDRFPSNERPWEATIEAPTKKSMQVVAEPIVCNVSEEFCRGCGRCEEVCEYSAIKMMSRTDGTFVARVDQSICRGCGACAAVCPSGAMIVGHFTDKWINKIIEKELYR
ncbi:MAG TPA: 4Fe-4S dicluster domain-containing protein [bacterium (Candidatus Stahlbacteria)]|nr:4Fe-4S dicluster domain-containing protein [Candidatus Stahlbacteria bacterium]